MERNTGIALAVSLLAVVSLWAFFYLNYSIRGLPLGWDTPYYIWKMEAAKGLGSNRFIAEEGYYHILYPVIGSWISTAGIDPFKVEIILPLLLWLAGFVLSTLMLTRELRDLNAVMLGTAAASMWFALFRLGSDLHANLMALALMLGGTVVFLHLPRVSSPLKFAIWSLGIGGIVVASSLVHVETTLFLSVVWVLTLFVCLWKKQFGSSRFVASAAAILLSLIPGLVVYYNQLRLTTAPLEGRLPTVPTMAPFVWLGYFGPVGVAVLVALPFVYKSSLPSILSTGIGALSISWLILSLIIGLAQYAYPPLTPFSERAVIMTPVPFLTAIVLPRIRRGKLVSRVKTAAIISMIIMGASGSYYLGIGHVYYDSFISVPSSRTLEDLRSQTVINIGNSVFVFYEDALSGGGLAEHDNFWAAAHLGDHYAYFGRVDFLMAGLETPFKEDRSELISKRFFNALPLNELANLNVMYLEEFNVPSPVPLYYQSFLNPIVRGAYLLDQSLWRSQGEISIPAYSSVFSNSQGWRSEAQDWAYSGKVLKFQSQGQNGPANATIAIPIPKAGNYTISLRVWDISTPANSVSVFLDRTLARRFGYNGTNVPVTMTGFSGYLERGVHYLSLGIQNQSQQLQFLSLDLVSVKN